METKICSKCGQERTISEFQMQPSGNRRNVCNKCRLRSFRIRHGKSYQTIEEARTAQRKRREEVIRAGGKICKKCNEWKPFSEFTKESRHDGKSTSLGGHKTKCKMCSRIPRELWKMGKRGPHGPYLSREEKEYRQRQREMKRRFRYHTDEKYRKQLIARSSQYDETVKARRAKYRKELNDVYIKTILQQTYPLRWSDFDSEILQMTRERMMAKRLLKQIRKEIPQ